MSQDMLNNDMAAGAAPPSGMASLTRMLRVLFFCFLTLIIAVFGYYFVFSGIFRVGEQYEAMLLRFGVLQQRSGENGSSPILQSGKWYWSYPYPVDEVIMVPANKSVSVSTENTFKAWVSPTGGAMGAGNRELRNGVDGYLVNGDMHIFHAEWVVSYKVDDAARFYLGFYDDNETAGHIGETHGSGTGRAAAAGERLRGHEAIIRNLLSDAVIAETANWTTEDLIKSTRPAVTPSGEKVVERLENAVRRRLAALVARIGLGIEIQTVNMVGQVQPPVAALQAFNQVNASERNKQTAVQRAQSTANSLLSQASARRERVIGEAQAEVEILISRLQAEKEKFELIREEYSRNPQSTLTVLYMDAVKELLSRVPSKYVLHGHDDGEGRQQLRLQINEIPEKPRSAASQEASAVNSEGTSVQPGAAK